MQKYIVLGLLVIAFGACGENGDEIASIDGEPVSKEQFNAYLKFKKIPINNTKLISNTLDKYLKREALVKAIEDENQLDAELIAAELDNFRSKMLIRRYFKEFLNKTVTEEVLANYYNTHSADFEKMKIKVAHILIRTNKKMNKKKRKAKLAKIHEAYSKIEAGNDFHEVAKEYSEDRISAKKGGKLGWLTEATCASKISSEILGMKSGQSSKPFETNSGYHIVLVQEGLKAVKKPFKSVVGSFRSRLRAEAKKAEMERLSKKTTIEKGTYVVDKEVEKTQ